MIYLLLAFELLLIIFAFILHDKELFAPPVIVCLFYFASNFLAMLNYDAWDLKLHDETVFIVAGSLAFFVLVSLVVKEIMLHTQDRYSVYGIDSFYQVRDCISYSKVIFCMTLVLQVITIAWQIRWVISVTGSVSSWAETMFVFRNTNSSYSLDAAVKPGLLSNLQVVSQILTYIYSYIFCFNLARKLDKSNEKKKVEIWLLLPLVLHTLLVFTNAGRGAALMVIMQIFVLAYMLIQQYRNWSVQFSFKFIGILIGGVCGILVAFSATRYIVGRANTSDMFTYISQYAGAALKNLDLFLQSPPEKSSIFGKETFGAIHNQLASVFGIEDWSYIRHLEFRYVNGIGLGNVYGALRYYYYDFGWAGVLIFVGLCSAVMTWLFYRIKWDTRTTGKTVNMKIFIFSYLSYALFMYPISEEFVNLIVTRANIKLLVFFYIAKWIIIDKKIQLKGFKIMIGNNISENDSQSNGMWGGVIHNPNIPIPGFVMFASPAMAN